MYLTTNNPGEFLTAAFRGVFSYAADAYRRSAIFSMIRTEGLTCYIPQPGYPYLNVRYGQLLWSKNTLQP